MRDRCIFKLNTKLRCFSEEYKNYKLSKAQSNNISKMMEVQGPKVLTIQGSKAQTRLPLKKNQYLLS